MRMPRAWLSCVTVLSLAACSGGADPAPPVPSTLQTTNEAEVIERGRFLVQGPAHCGACHTSDMAEAMAARERGEDAVPSGGFALHAGPMTLFTPNLTPDNETGIGRYTDAELVRALRHNINPAGRTMIPMMAFQDMADSDIRAIISYLRSIEPVRNEVRAHKIPLPMKLMLPVMVKPIGPDSTPPQTPPKRAATVAWGGYLVENVALCSSCHTKLGPTGKPAGPHLAGGFEMPDEIDPSTVYVTPNLTPDPETGVTGQMSEDAFVARFRMGRMYAGSHMPWEWYQELSEDDLRAIYRYLKTVEPVNNDVSPIVRTES